MISKTKKTKPIVSENTWMKYCVVFDDHSPVGVNKHIEKAKIFAGELAKEKNAEKLSDSDIWQYEDSSGVHYITISFVQKIKINKE